LCLSHFTTNLLEFIKELLHVFHWLHVDAKSFIYALDVAEQEKLELMILCLNLLDLAQRVVCLFHVVDVWQFEGLCFPVEVNKVKLVQFAEFVHQSPVVILVDLYFIQRNIFGSRKAKSQYKILMPYLKIPMIF
jgi:hypothetical protein